MFLGVFLYSKYSNDGIGDHVLPPGRPGKNGPGRENTHVSDSATSRNGNPFRRVSTPFKP